MPDPADPSPDPADLARRVLDFGGNYGNFDAAHITLAREVLRLQDQLDITAEHLDAASDDNDRLREALTAAPSRCPDGCCNTAVCTFGPQPDPADLARRVLGHDCDCGISPATNGYVSGCPTHDVRNVAAALASAVLRLQEQVAQLRAALAETADALADTEGYVGDYFWQKHGYGDDVATARALSSPTTTPSGQPNPVAALTTAAETVLADHDGGADTSRPDPNMEELRHCLAALTPSGTEPAHEVECPSCGATIRARMADQ